MDEQIVFKLLKASLFNGDMEVPEDWNDVFEEMKLQTVAGLPSVWLKKHSEIDLHEWVKYCAVLQAQWLHVMHGQNMLFQLLEENGIPCIILKGAAAAMYYPNPSLRTMGDVDILVKRADFYKAVDLIENNGYKLAHEKQVDAYHYNYQKQGISFELHRRLPILQESDEELISLFEYGINHRELKETEGNNILD
ncbi:MAG: nucleotidyltransferase family protein [Oscillospiraceae bacterium]|nr:nucleotidyltransferase family protein [Oscillospiraceae bacterium]